MKTSSSSSEPCPPKKILIIEDHILFRDGLRSLFRNISDFQIAGEAGTVQEGVEIARLIHPDIVLMDYTLPDGVGPEATKRILREFPECKIIFLTVHESEDKLFTAIRAGAKGFVPKNIDGKLLISGLRALDRGEVVFPPKMTASIVEEFSRTEKTAVEEDILADLTTRQVEVLKEIETGASNAEIAERLFLSENTVKNHVKNIFKKLNVDNRHQAAHLARQAGLSSGPDPH